MLKRKKILIKIPTYIILAVTLIDRLDAISS